MRALDRVFVWVVGDRAKGLGKNLGMGVVIIVGVGLILAYIVVRYLFWLYIIYTNVERSVVIGWVYENG